MFVVRTSRRAGPNFKNSGNPRFLNSFYGLPRL
jgi:hypothetical protein